MTSKSEFRGRWIAALRSGAYQQGTLYLRTLFDTFCCWGVACELVDAKRWEPHCQGQPIFQFGYLTTGMPPPDVVERTGLSPDQVILLMNLNDAGMSFSQIADRIEQYDAELRQHEQELISV